MIAAAFLELLACPRCKGGLERSGDEALACPACRLAFAVRDGVPVLLVDEAQPLDG